MIACLGFILYMQVVYLNVLSNIIISLIFFSFFEMIKWSYLDVLLNPVLSDSFGLSLSVSSYFYLGLTIPRIIGALIV